jgi:hypothetical protein
MVLMIDGDFNVLSWDIVTQGRKQLEIQQATALSEFKTHSLSSP